MVTIDSLGNSSATGVFQLNKNEQEEQRKAIDERLKDGDTVKISAEAMELFKSKLEEYGAQNPGDLTKDQKEDLKDTMESFAEENNIDPENMPRPGGIPPGGMPPEGEGGNPGGKQEGQGGRDRGPGGAGKAGGGQQAASSDSTDDVEDKEDEIETLQDEITQLRAEATNDEKAAEKLKTKEVELAALQAELALLESQSA
ncbi:hypothetical protein FMR86_01935 [Desulfovibrio sp. JC010]|nr:hypothetical protein [Desulfovibrio sp. JC010]